MRQLQSACVGSRLFPQIMEEVVEVVKLVPQARVQRIDEKIVEVRTTQITEEIVEEFRIVPQAIFGKDQ